MLELEKLKTYSQYDSKYYEQLKILQKEHKISSLITYETVNEAICNDSTNQITLFGTLKHLQDNAFKKDNKNKLILWEDNVDIRIYNQAALIITQANCIIADPCFFKVSVGISLINYISTKCKLIVLGNEIINIPCDTCDTKYLISPHDFIEHLSSALD